LNLALREQLLSPDEIATMLTAAGAPSSPIEIGLSMEQVRASYEAATHIRRRYTVYDLAHDLGIFDELVDEVFRGDGYFNRIGPGGLR
jgi:glycerol-1-phosphate dehydrogenase [NAD(P)+]